MKSSLRVLGLAVVLVFSLSVVVFGQADIKGEVAVPAAGDEILFTFEEGLQGWDIPEWAFTKPDHVQREVAIAEDFASDGLKSMKVLSEFPGGSWSCSIVEIMQQFDLTNYKKLMVDLYLPADGPTGLKAKLILTVGPEWKWVEMSRDFNLEPGKWITLGADIMPGSIDWKGIQIDDSFRADIRKMYVRVVSEKGPAYSGPVYVDNMRAKK